MPDYLPKKETEPEGDPRRPSNTRLTIWIVVGAIALYMIGSGVWGLLTH
jgi:hypothetical protein